jgi:hypothetical protein
MDVTTPGKSIVRKAWIVVRFVLFGCLGLYVVFVFTVAFVAQVFYQDRDSITPFLSLPLAFVGLFMMLYGVGEWRRWAYLWVFLSMPISLCLFLLIPGAGNDKGSPVIIAAVTAFATYAGVRAYYARRVREKRHDDNRAA